MRFFLLFPNALPSSKAHCPAPLGPPPPAPEKPRATGMGPLTARARGFPRCLPRRGLTLRSSGAPTAGHQAQAAGALHIACALGLASYRRRPLSSNVRPRESSSLRFSIRLGLEASPRSAPVAFCASLRLGPCGSFLCSPTLCPLPSPPVLYRLVLHHRLRKSRGLLAWALVPHGSAASLGASCSVA